MTGAPCSRTASANNGRPTLTTPTLAGSDNAVLPGSVLASSVRAAALRAAQCGPAPVRAGRARLRPRLDRELVEESCPERAAEDEDEEELLLLPLLPPPRRGVMIVVFLRFVGVGRERLTHHFL